MEERQSDTEATFGEQDPPAPEQESSQNTDYPGASGSGGPENDDDSPGSASNSPGGSNERAAGRVGGAGEHSQATGNPLNAG